MYLSDEDFGGREAVLVQQTVGSKGKEDTSNISPNLVKKTSYTVLCSEPFFLHFGAK